MMKNQSLSTMICLVEKYQEIVKTPDEINTPSNPNTPNQGFISATSILNKIRTIF